MVRHSDSMMLPRGGGASNLLLKNINNTWPFQLICLLLPFLKGNLSRQKRGGAYIWELKINIIWVPQNICISNFLLYIGKLILKISGFKLIQKRRKRFINEEFI